MKYIEHDTEHNILRLRLSKELYDINVIKESVEQFSSSHECKFIDGDYAIVEIVPEEDKDMDPKEIAYEFFNYVLALMKNKAIV